MLNMVIIINCKQFGKAKRPKCNMNFAAASFGLFSVLLLLQLSDEVAGKTLMFSKKIS